MESTNIDLTHTALSSGVKILVVSMVHVQSNKSPFIRPILQNHTILYKKCRPVSLSARFAFNHLRNQAIMPFDHLCNDKS